MNKIAFLLYRYFFLPFALGILFFLRPLLRGKLREVIEVRRGPQLPSLVARPIWIHASSGEIEYAKPLIRELKKHHPLTPLLLTYFSPSAVKLATNIPELDLLWPLPFDGRRSMRRFFDHVQPRLLLISRTDVWPELAYQAKCHQIPSYLFSATLAANSSRLNWPARYLNAFAFNQLNKIFCVSRADQKAFQDLGVTTEIEVVGDTRFDQTQFRLLNARPLKIQIEQAAKLPILVVGSSWPEDEEVLATALNKLSLTNLQIIWAPHEVQEAHLLQLESLFQSHSWSFARYSKLSPNISWPQIILIDQVGILPELYTLGDFAFVGGSFKGRVHSVMEPLTAGLPVLVGPHYQNNREALQFAAQVLPSGNTAVIPAPNAADLHSHLARLCRDFLSQQKKTETKQEITNVLAPYFGVSERLAKALFPLPPDGKQKDYL